MVDMQSEKVCLHPSSVWLQGISGGVVHPVRVKCITVTKTDGECPEQLQ